MGQSRNRERTDRRESYIYSSLTGVVYVRKFINRRLYRSCTGCAEMTQHHRRSIGFASSSVVQLSKEHCSIQYGNKPPKVATFSR